MYEKIPNELKSLKQWCCYKITPDEAREGKFKSFPSMPTRVAMHRAITNRLGAILILPLQAVDKLKLDGLGFFFANGYFGVDIDNAFDS